MCCTRNKNSSSGITSHENCSKHWVSSEQLIKYFLIIITQ